MSDQQSGGGVPALSAGLRCRCPRCGQGSLFAGYLTVAEICASCDLDLRQHDSGDGPAFFVMSIVGAVVVALAMCVELSYQPAYWIHMVLWGPLILAGTFGLLRPAKALLIALQYKHRADSTFDDE
jgi:uncharacterized protein (DUF983 family)